MKSIKHKIMIRELGDDKHYFLYSIKIEFAAYVKVINVLEYHDLTFLRAKELSFKIQGSVEPKYLELRYEKTKRNK